MLILRAAALLALVLPTGFVPGTGAQDDEAKGPRCTGCKQVGSLPCDEHKAKDCLLETNVQYCSEMAGCTVCGGTGFVDCERCSFPEAEEALARKRSRIEGIGKRLAKIDEGMERSVRKAESEHFTLVWEVDELKVGRKRLKAHELMHLYVDRLEELYALYTTTFGVEDSEFRKKSQVMVWYFPQDQKRASSVFTGNASERGAKLLGGTPAFTTLGSKQTYATDEQLHRGLVHNVSHLLLSHQRPSMWVGNVKGGWADAGVAHWFENELFGICDNYCYQEVANNRDFKGGKWKPAVRKLVTGDDAPPVADTMRQNTTTLTLPQHAVSFSYIDFLIHTDPKKTNKLLQKLRAKAEVREVMQDLFGWNLFQFEEAWKEWVKATYPTR